MKTGTFENARGEGRLLTTQKCDVSNEYAKMDTFESSTRSLIFMAFSVLSRVEQYEHFIAYSHLS